MVKRWMTLIVALLLTPWLGATYAEPTVTATQAGQGLLWRIEKAGVKPSVKPSYLLGTMHSEDPAIVALSKPVMAALERSDRVSLEMVMDPENMDALSRAMQITSEPELPEVVGKDLYRQLVQPMSEQGVPEHILRGMKPWAAAMTLMVPKSNTGLFLDRVLYLEAIAKAKPVEGLETAAEQVAVFEGLDPADQVQLVKEALKAYPQLEQTYAELRDAYLKHDLQALVAINDAALKEGDPAFVERVNARLIVDRNLRMAGRMQSGLASGNTFFAVGALHLPGEQGILQLLRKQGYTVTSVY